MCEFKTMTLTIIYMERGNTIIKGFLFSLQSWKTCKGRIKGGTEKQIKGFEHTKWKCVEETSLRKNLGLAEAFL